MLCMISLLKSVGVVLAFTGLVMVSLRVYTFLSEKKSWGEPLQHIKRWHAAVLIMFLSGAGLLLTAMAAATPPADEGAYYFSDYAVVGAGTVALLASAGATFFVQDILEAMVKRKENLRAAFALSSITAVNTVVYVIIVLILFLAFIRAILSMVGGVGVDLERRMVWEALLPGAVLIGTGCFAKGIIYHLSIKSRGGLNTENVGEVVSWTVFVDFLAFLVVIWVVFRIVDLIPTL